MTALKMLDVDIERMIDIIGEGELTAEAEERLHREGLWPLYESPTNGLHGFCIWERKQVKPR